MPGTHKDQMISFRADEWQHALINNRVALSGLYKRDFIANSCIYSNIVVVGHKETVRHIVDSLQEMQYVLKEIAGQIQSGDFSMSEDTYMELKRDYLALIITIVDIANGAAYLYDKVPDKNNQHWKRKQELEQYRIALGLGMEGERI